MRQYIVDTTLRDGEQTPGVNFFPHEKIEIAALLHEAGVQEVEAGIPVMGEGERDTIRAIVGAGHNFKTIVWSRAIKGDIDVSALCNAQGINISFPVSDVHLSAIKQNRSWVLNQLPLLVNCAREKFQFVVVGLQDATRADTDFLYEVVDRAVQSGADRIRIADTVGVMSPVKVMNLFSALSLRFGAFDFEFHAHNDFGMATANAVTALACGASGVSCTVNGLGERAGNAALEEVVMHHHQLGESPFPVRVELLQQLSEKVSDYSRKTIPPSKPVVGRDIFKHESGIHVQGLLQNKFTYQPFDEGMIRQEASAIVYGKHSGKAAIGDFFAKHQVELKEKHLGRVFNSVMQMAAMTKGGLSSDQLWKAYQSAMSCC